VIGVEWRRQVDVVLGVVDLSTHRLWNILNAYRAEGNRQAPKTMNFRNLLGAAVHLARKMD